MNIDAVSRIPLDWPHREFSRFVSAGQLDWHVQVMGAGPVVLLLHGTGSSAHSWADVMPRLAKTCTVIAPDLPGHGATRGATRATLTLPRIASELDLLLRELGITSPAVVVGHSAGAALALRWLLGTRNRPRAMVGFNPSLIPPPALYMKLIAPIVTPVATSPRVASALASLAARTFLVRRLLASTRSALSERQRARYTALFSNPAHVRGTLEFMAGADLQAILDDARTLTIPMTFVVASRDAWVPERRLRRVIARALPLAHLVGREGGHLWHEEAPAVAAALIRSVLESELD